MLASRLAELERQLDGAEEEAVSALWAEYYTALDLWLRVRGRSMPTTPITQSMLKERFTNAKR